MKIGLYYYEKVLNDRALIEMLEQSFQKEGIETSVFTDTEKISNVDTLIVLGGDGTILPAALVCGRQGIPVVGINYGHLGFLTELERSECESVVQLIKKDSFIKEERSAIVAKLNGKEYYALNEVSVQRQFNADIRRQIIALEAKIDGKLIDEYMADGLLVCTPTGSTGYALSAGGAVLSPDINAFMLTPICAHSLRSRPVVYSDQRKLQIRLSKSYQASIFCDGKQVANMDESDELVIQKANFNVCFLVRGQTNFYDKLFYKMNQWSGGRNNGS